MNEDLPYEKILTDIQAKKTAVRIAKLAYGFVTPNPVVGCVILSENNKLIGAGYHKKFGGPHAEVEAIDDCCKRFNREALRHSTLFVTLEPCGHVGKTPSCAHFLATYGIRKVVFSTVDPNPLVASKGLKFLHQQGIVIEHDVNWSQETDLLNDIFLHVIVNKTPFVAVKVATDITGAMASESFSKQISITPSFVQLDAHDLRQKYDGICVGRQTVMVDDPLLTNRSNNFSQVRHPKRIILDAKNAILSSAKRFKILDETQAETIFVTEEEFLADFHNGVFQLKPILFKMQQKYSIQSVLVEGGAKTIGEFFDQKAVHKLYHYRVLEDLNISQPKFWNQEIHARFDLKKLGSRTFSDFNCEVTEYTVRF